MTKQGGENESGAVANPGGRSVWWWIIGASGMVVVALVLVLPKPRGAQTANAPSSSPGGGDGVGSPSSPNWSLTFKRPPVRTVDAREVVASKVQQFARSRLAITTALAKKMHVEMPVEVSAFYAAVETGDWEKAKELFERLKQTRQAPEGGQQHLESLWPAILETFGVAEVAQKWPAQTLLDYGETILGNMKPGMVYLGGTDAGRFIPTLLAETSEGERPIVLTQNAFADRTYLDYASVLYGERLSTLSNEDSERAFSEYIADAQKRYQHDQQFPNEPKQVRPGEDIRITEGRVQVGGQVAVMAINERLFQMLMNKNPDLIFAIEESFPFKSTYANAVPLGPIMELGSADAQNAYTPEALERTLDFWASTSAQFSADTQGGSDSEARKAYSKMASAHARLFAEHGMTAQAVQAFQFATQIWAASPEVVFGYVNLLLQQSRVNDAIQVVQSGLGADPQNAQFRALLGQLQRQSGK